MIEDRKILMLFPAFILLWIGLSPKGSIPGDQYVSFLIIFVLASVVPLLKHRNFTVMSYATIFSLVFLLWWLASIFSFIVNINNIRIGSFFEVGKPVLFASLFICGYSSLKENGVYKWQKTLGGISKFLILFILSVSVVQLFSPDFFSSIWNSDKTRGLGSLVRVTGTMYNPNSMAFFMSFLCLGITAFQGIKRSWLWILMTLVLLVLASSRTLLIAFPVALVTVYWIHTSQKGVVFASFKMLFLFASFLAAIYWGIYLFVDDLPYAGQLLMVINSPEAISEVSSFATREEQWGDRIDFWLSGGVVNLLFGAGSVTELQVGDNDLIYVFTRLGIYGVFVHILVYLMLLLLAWEVRKSSIGLWLAGIMMIAIISGLTMESLGGWQPPIYIFLIAGAAYASMEEKKNNSIVFKKVDGYV